MAVAALQAERQSPLFSRGKRLLSSISDKRVTDYIVPVLLTALLAVLGWIGSTLQAMSQTLAVAVYRIDSLEQTEKYHFADHERRLETLETERFKAGMK